MSHLRNLRVTALLTGLLVAWTAGPALAGPAPLDREPAGSSGGGATTDIGTSSDPSVWTPIGLGVAAVLAVAVVALALMAVVRHTHHHAPHPV
jgi:hypothetical protein